MLSIGSKRWSQLSSFTGMRTHKWWIAQQYLSAYHEIADICTSFFYCFTAVWLNMSPQSDWGHLLSLFLNWVKGTAWVFFFFMFHMSSYCIVLTPAVMSCWKKSQNPKWIHVLDLWRDTAGQYSGFHRNEHTCYVNRNPADYWMDMNWLFIFSVCVYMNIY